MKKILRVRPHKRPRKMKRSPKPRFHAIKPEVFKRMLPFIPFAETMNLEARGQPA